MKRYNKLFEFTACVLLMLFLLYCLKVENEPAMVQTYLSLLIFVKLILVHIFSAKE